MAAMAAAAKVGFRCHFQFTGVSWWFLVLGYWSMQLTPHSTGEVNKIICGDGGDCEALTPSPSPQGEGNFCGQMIRKFRKILQIRQFQNGFLHFANLVVGVVVVVFVGKGFSDTKVMGSWEDAKRDSRITGLF